ncbi:MAG: Por secretion system protein, partial [Bacteroidaceae bacterium]|nr:Por secretion system protein [Bacteroidaceae bacterium]
PGKDSAYGQGAHSLAVGDVDNDGCDEIIYGSATIDHNGSLLSSTGLGHGDALHLADILPDRPGLEVFMVHEGRNANCCAEIHDPVTGEILWREDSQNGRDNGRGVAMNLFADTKGYEWWSLSSNNIFTADGTTGRRLAVLADSSPKPTNFRIYWDGDLQDEPYDGNIVYKPLMTKTSVGDSATVSTSGKDSATISFRPLATLKGNSCNGTKRTPNLLADIFGDWREEVVLYNNDTCDKLYIHTTTIPTPHRMTTLMHNHIYRMGIAWQNSAYNQPPHVVFE